ncbi:hypothetical protein FRC07_007917 [Ceratobasidium sp. 392]|nr:hypothetical protein FRC07_007917 [Ceratobasidium sp. 392]
MRFYYFSSQLSINELQMLSPVSPSPETAQLTLLRCKDSAALVLKHVVDDMAPSGYIPYTQDGIAFATAYAGVWLYKSEFNNQLLAQHLSRFEPAIVLETTGLFRALVEACETESRNPKDIPSCFARFFSHLVRNSAPAGSSSDQISESTSGLASNTMNLMFPEFQFSTTDYSAYVPAELTPPLDGMDAHRVNVTNGLDDWWKNYTYLGSLSGYMGR